MEPKKHWLRWTEKTRTFPTKKYNFTDLLKYTGDMVETYPMPYEDYIRFKDAAKFWAARRGKKIRIYSQKYPGRQRVCRITLVSHTREPPSQEVIEYWNVLQDSTKRSSKKQS